jgi:hypothetical protein
MQREMRGATTVGRCLAGGGMVGEEKWGLTSDAPTTLQGGTGFKLIQFDSKYFKLIQIDLIQRGPSRAQKI